MYLRSTPNVVVGSCLRKNSDTSRDDIRVFSARMGHGAVNKLIGGTKPFP